jgi:ribose transport system ATP-binding protein
MRTVGRALFGLEKVLDGKVELGNIEIKNPNVAINNKMGYISKNRDTESLGLSATIYENISSTGYKINELFTYIISGKKEKKYVDKQIEGAVTK